MEEVQDTADPSEVDRVELVRETVVDGRTFRLRAAGSASDRVEIELVAEDRVTGDNGVVLRGEVLVSDLPTAAASLGALLNAVSTAFGAASTSRSLTIEDIRRRYPNAYRPWTEDDEARLTERFNDGVRVAELARELGRQPGGVRSRLVRLGLIEPELAAGKSARDVGVDPPSSSSP